MPGRVYSSSSLIEAGYIQGLIQSHGISCYIVNGNLQGAAGELPVLDCGPEIWVTNESDQQQAKKIITDAQTIQTPTGSGRNCDQCGEYLPPQFTDCWNCTTADGY